MAAESNRNPDLENDLEPLRLTQERKALRKHLSDDKLVELDSLPPAQQERWYAMAARWSAPEQRLTAIEAEINNAEHPPAFHIPTAEGVATYRGLFGGNGSLSEDQKDAVRRLLKRAVRKPLAKEENRAAGEGNPDDDRKGTPSGESDT